MRKERLTNNLLFSICCFLVLILCIILILGGYMYSFFYKTVYSEFLAEQQKEIVTIADKHENDLQFVDNIVTQLSLSEDITGFLLKENPNKGRNLIARLRQYDGVSQFFSTILYYNHRDDYIFNEETSASVQFFVKEGCILEKNTSEELYEYLTSESMSLHILPEQEEHGKWLGSYVNGKNKVFFFRAIPPKCEETLLFIVPEVYYNRLLKGSEKEEEFKFLVYDGQVIVSRGTMEVSSEQIQELWLQDGQEFKQETIEIGEKEYLMSIQKGNSDICYGNITPLSEFYNKVRSEQWGIVLLILVCFGLAVVVFFFYSGRLLRKVQSIGKLLEKDGGYNLNNIEEGIQALITTYEEAQTESILQKKLIFIRNFLRGDYSTREKVIEDANKVGLNIDFQQYVIVIVKNRESNNEIKIFSEILKMLHKEESVTGCGVRLISNNRNVFVLFGDESEKIELVLEKFLNIENEYGLDFVIAVSEFHTDFTNGANAYLEADMAFDNHLLLDNSRIIRFAEMQQGNYSNILVDNDVKQLKYALRTGDITAVEAAISGMCAKLKCERVPLYAFRIFYLDIINVLLKEWNDKEIQLERFYNVFTLSQCMNAQDFYNLLLEICQSIVERKSNKGHQDIVQEAIKYMESHYHDPGLNINALVDYLGVNSVVLASEFKKAMDLRPTDYLRNLRIEKAKHLLRTTDMKVKEISLAVGYEDEHVLMRWFKEYTGKTPKQYRKEQESVNQ